MEILKADYLSACAEVGLKPVPFLVSIIDLSIRNRTELQSITIKGNDARLGGKRITDRDLEAICVALARNQTVKELNLAYNVLTDHGAQTLAILLQKKPISAIA
eukprot:Opistho-2@38423